MSEFHKLSIKAIEKVTENCVTLSFHVSEDLTDIFSFKAGQYITLKTKLNNQEIRRDYSLCSSPFSNELTVAVKEVKEGLFSKYANHNFKVGDTIEVSAPRGRFVYEPDNNNAQTIVAFAAGSGITPIMSIIKTILQKEQHSKIVLVYGNKTPQNTIFYTTILNLKADYPNRFFTHFVFSESKEEGAFFGRIEKSTVNFVIKNQYKNDEFKAFYLCGPETMIQNVSAALNANDIDSDRIFFELFTTTSTAEEIAPEISDGKTKITIMVDDEETEFEMSQKKSILEAALENDIDAPFSCQGGICSSCLARISKGSATMRQNNILTDKEVEDGLILTCQAHPTTASIYVDYDDV